MDLLILEVDGSLSNLYAAGAVAIWTAIVSVIAVLLVRRGGPAVSTWAMVAASAIVLVLTRPAQLLIGTALYRLADDTIVSVGFWDGPPIWIAPLAALGAGVLARARVARRESRPNPERSPGA
jgi:hypothetical protein